MNIFVTGIGVVSAIGLDAGENFHSLKTGVTGIRRSPVYNLMLGDVELSNEQMMQQLDLPHEDFSRTTLLSLLAAKEAWGRNKKMSDIRTGIISSTSVGGLDRTEKYYFESQTNRSSESYKLMTHDNGRTTEVAA